MWWLVIDAMQHRATIDTSIFGYDSIKINVLPETQSTNVHFIIIILLLYSILFCCCVSLLLACVIAEAYESMKGSAWHDITAQIIDSNTNATAKFSVFIIPCARISRVCSHLKWGRTHITLMSTTQFCSAVGCLLVVQHFSVLSPIFSKQ